MLHATSKGKTKFYKRYLGQRDGEDRKVYEEDEITSTLIGPMEFLPASDVYRFWENILNQTEHNDFLPKIPPEHIETTLWSRRKAMDDGNIIEPDVVVTLKWPDRVYNLLIELKWRAALSGKEQLHRQWLQYLTSHERTYSLHLFIAPSISEGAKALAEKDVWNGRLVLLPWMKVRDVLGKYAEDKTAIGRWAKLSDTFLAHIQILRFGGFAHIVNDSNLLLTSLPPTIFWYPHKFSGWGECIAHQALPNTLPNPIFFTHSQGDVK